MNQPVAQPFAQPILLMPLRMTAPGTSVPNNSRGMGPG